MEAIKFVYWLQGHFEIENPTEINSEQLEIIKEKLNSVFEHEVEIEESNIIPTNNDSGSGSVVRC